MKFNSENMCKGPIFKGIILYTLPIILSSLLQLFFNAADLIVVGNFGSENSVAAVGSTGSLTSLIVNGFIGLSVGAGATVARALGAGNYREASTAVHTSITVAVIGGAVISLIGIFCSEFFLTLMGSPEEVLPLSTVYMQIYFAGMIFSMVYNFGASVLRATGDTKGPLTYLTIAGVLNVILNIFFVVSLKMDVAGVALATSISQAVSAILTVNALIRRQDACRLDLKELRIDKPVLFKILKIGIPAGIQSSLFNISNVLIQSSINSFGSLYMSGNAAAGNIEGFCYVAMNSFGQTTLNFCGQNYGAGNIKRVKKITLASMLTVSAVGLFVGNVLYLFGEPLLGIYLADAPNAIPIGLERMQYILLPYFLCGLMDTVTGALRGLGSSLLPMIITVFGACVLRVVWIYSIFAMPEYHTFSGLLVSYPISWFLTFSAILICYFIVVNKRSKELQDKQC